MLQGGDRQGWSCQLVSVRRRTESSNLAKCCNTTLWPSKEEVLAKCLWILNGIVSKLIYNVLVPRNIEDGTPTNFPVLIITPSVYPP